MVLILMLIVRDQLKHKTSTAGVYKGYLPWLLLLPALAFFTPIILALLLSEGPRFKIFFRTLFFLPHMTSGLVVTLMWKEMFAGTADGSINRLCAALLDPLHAFAEHLHAWAGCDLTAWLCDKFDPGLSGFLVLSENYSARDHLAANEVNKV
jgi:ABC-type sugar transport system permease subunit